MYDSASKLKTVSLKKLQKHQTFSSFSDQQLKTRTYLEVFEFIDPLTAIFIKGAPDLQGLYLTGHLIVGVYLLKQKQKKRETKLITFLILSYLVREA